MAAPLFLINTILEQNAACGYPVLAVKRNEWAFGFWLLAFSFWSAAGCGCCVLTDC